MKRALWTIAKFAVSAAIIIYLVQSAARDGAFDKLWNQPKDWSLLTAAWAVSLFGVVLTFIRWYYLVRALELPFTLRDAFRLGFLCYLLNFVSLGIVGGDLFKAIFVAREQPGRRAEAVATVVLDRVIGLYALFLVASAAIVLTGLYASPVRNIRVICWMTLACTAAGGLGVMMMLTPGFTSGAVSEFLGGLPRVGPVLSRLIWAVRIYRRKYWVLIGTLLLSFGVHTCSTVGIYLIARALPGAALGLSQQFVAVPLAFVTMILPLPAMGLGAFEAALAFLYVNLPSSVPIAKDSGLIVALAYRVITITIAAVGVVIWLANRRDVSRVMHEAEEEAESETPAERAITR